MEEEGELVGVAIFYDGAKARELDVPLERAAAKKSGDSNYPIPTEPEASEFYMDALSVSPPCQGKGYWSFHNLGDVTAFKKGPNQGRAFRHSF